MVPPDGERSKRIPTLSWDSVVNEPASSPVAATTVAPPPPPQPKSESAFELTPLVLDLASHESAGRPVAEVVEAPVSFAPLVLDSMPPSPPRQASPAPVPAPPVAAPLRVGTTPDEPPVSVRVAPPAVIVPALGDVTSGPTDLAPSIANDALPEIREATPTIATDIPMLPTVPPPAPRPVSTTPFEFEAAPTPAKTATQHRRRKGQHRAVKLVATLVVLGGLVAAGVVFGRSYLTAGDWDGATAPYADAVVTSRGVEFAEPLSIIAEPTAAFTSRVAEQIAGPWADEQAMWRALGLLSGSVDDAVLADQIGGWQDALYSADDGQVYHDVGAAGADLDAQLTQAMAAAALDQEFAWSPEQPNRMLDAAASTSAEVLRQSRAIQAASTFPTAADPVSTANLAALPPVISYRMLAPQVFAEFPGSPAGTTNPLSGLGSGGPGLLGSELPMVATPPTMFEGDTALDAPGTKDRSFWFLVFGGFLDGRTAFSASESIVESSLTRAVRGPAECVYSTFSGGDVAQTETLRSSLEAWVAAAPAELQASFLVLADGTLQLFSCDPGTAFQSGARAGVAGEVVAWRAVELAAHDAVAAAGGSDTDFANVWFLIGLSDLPPQVAALPAGTPPATIAAAAREGVAALYAPAG